ncbi:hypothetical protein RSAG8_00302, partial [Rhizoctonia solani AG-8 WAC10335]
MRLDELRSLLFVATLMVGFGKTILTHY